MLERRAEGVAIATFGVESPLLEQLTERKVPLVFRRGPGMAYFRSAPLSGSRTVMI